jgi:predicted nuclease of predicted toxin-antitoxin system
VNLLADESVDRPIVERLWADNHSVVYVAELDPGVSDDAVLERANRSGMLLITADRDFGELVFRLGRIHAGVVLIRLTGLSSKAKANAVSRALAERGDELLSAFSVISPGSLRIRRMVDT